LEALHAGFDLETGPLMKAVWYRLDEDDHLLLLAHHLVIDAVSWHFLMEDIGAAYSQALAGSEPRLPPRLPPKTASYRDWAGFLTRHAESDALLAEIPYWRAIDEAPANLLSTDLPRTPHRFDETRLLTIDVPLPPTGLDDGEVLPALLAALSRALAAWDGRELTRVTLSSHGRLPPAGAPDVSRTVGWFAAEYPFLLAGPSGGSIRSQIAGIDATLRRVPAGGLGYGVLRYLTPRTRLTGMSFPPLPEIAVNYLGRVDAAEEGGFSVSDRVPGTSIGGLDRPTLFDFEAMLAGGRLSITLRYCPKLHEDRTAARLCALLQRELG
jgi:non-ribosomal peptide synthase protein (TIGR01720 family)